VDSIDPLSFATIAMSYRNRRSVAVLGVPFDNVTMHEAMGLIEEKIEEQGFHQVATANVDFIVNAIHDQSLQEMLCSCDLVVPDGMPIVWASRLTGSKLKERVSGVGLLPRLAELAAKRRYGIYLLGASEKTSRRASEVLKKRFPKLRIVGRHSLSSRLWRIWITKAFCAVSSVPNQTSCWSPWAAPSKGSGLACIVTG
jgi:UDP-N-acetyl-D-mannosaminuronic acid transferase (WecB/TagA/CpsF family)